MPSDPQTGSCGVLIVGHERGQLAEIALFCRPAAVFGRIAGMVFLSAVAASSTIDWATLVWSEKSAEANSEDSSIGSITLTVSWTGSVDRDGKL